MDTIHIIWLTFKGHEQQCSDGTRTAKLTVRQTAGVLTLLS
jgi:hypothetical protein